jgi:CHAT domain-containing protein/tetratricopeptide (TPR) repeat protein
MIARGLRLRDPGRWGLVVLVLSSCLLTARAAEPPRAEEPLAPGDTARERSIAAGEIHAYRVTVEPRASLLVTVEQKSIGLVLAIQGPGGGPPLRVGAGNDLWGPVVALLDEAGSYRIEVRPREMSAWPGRYAIRVETLPKTEPTPEDRARRRALDLMSRAGREAFDPTPEARQRAIALYREALAAWRTVGDRAWEADSRVCLGALEQNAGDLTAATEDFAAALTLWRDLGEPRREAEALDWLGILFQRTKDAKTAREALEGARALWQRVGEPLQEAQTRYNLCSFEHRYGSLATALDCFTEIRALARSLGDDGQEALTLNHLGGIYDSLGKPDQALASYQEALSVYRRLGGDRHRETEILSNIALLDLSLGEWQEVLHLYGEVRANLSSLGDPSLEAALLNNIGYTYLNVGLPERALPSLEAALKLRQAGGDRLAEITTRNNLGTAWRKAGKLNKALAEHRQALRLALDLGNVGQQATTRLRLTEAYLEAGDAAAALRDADAALPLLAKSGDRRTETGILYQRGRALLLAGKAQEALRAFTEVLARRRTVRDRAGETETLAALAEAERAAGDSFDARAHAREAVDGIEKLRGSFSNPDLRASFLAQRRQAFSLLIDLLLDPSGPAPSRDDVREAFAISECAHARSLLDALVTAGAVRTTNAATGELLARRRSLLRQLSDKGDERWKLSGERAEAVEREIDTIQTEILGVEAEIRQKDPRFAPASESRPVAPEEVSRWLDPGTALLEYSLGEKRSFLWVVDSRGLRSFVLPGERRIETQARRVYEELRSAKPGSEAGRKAAFALAKTLLGPIWSEAATLSRLVIVPDGALHVLPFIALPVPPPGRGWGTPEAAEPLLLHLEVAYAPSASALAVERQLAGRPPAAKWAAVLADPLFSPDDPRLARGGPGLSGSGKGVGSEAARRGASPRRTPVPLVRLPASRREAEAIRSLAPAGQVWVGLGADARRETVVSGALRDYRFLHFATHALADAQTPELSGLVLSEVDAQGRPSKGFLGLADLYELDLHADLVVLSGCETALGKEVRGEGLMSLTRAFQFAGVPRVMASLWQVEDRTTAELMTRFYRALWRDHLPVAAALRAAQRALYGDPRYHAAHAWAAFVLQGDWK